MILMIKVGDKVMLSKVESGMHPTDPYVHVCGFQAGITPSEVTITEVAINGRTFKVVENIYLWHIDHIKC